MEENLQGFGIGRQHDELSLPTVKRLGCLVGSFPQLLVVGCLLDQVEDLGSQSLLGQRVSLGVHFFSLQ